MLRTIPISNLKKKNNIHTKNIFKNNETRKGLLHNRTFIPICTKQKHKS